MRKRPIRADTVCLHEEAPPLLRLIGFFVLAFFLAQVLGYVPIIGPVFARTGCLGVWVTAILLSWVISKYGERVVRARRDSARVRELAAVDSPHNKGKLGSLILAQGRPAKAIESLEAAVRGEPEVAEWHYRLGMALLATRRAEEAVSALRRCVELEEEHAYGAAQMRLAEASLAAGHAEEALEVLRTFERNHGPSPESAYRIGLALKAAGKRDEARAAFDDVGRLARAAARYQKRDAGAWSLRARLASWF